MGNEYSTLLYTFGAEFCVSSAAYHLVFWKLFRYYKRKLKDPKSCLLLSTNTISTINAVIIPIPGLIDFVIYKRWERPTIDEPKIAGHIWAVCMGYLNADLIGHLLCFMRHNKHEIPRRWDTIIHHIILLSFWIGVEFPKPIYVWNIFALFPAWEITTIFLNLQWLGKHFKHKKLERISQLLFVALWFPVRVGITVYCLYCLVKYWKKIRKDLPPRQSTTLVTCLIPFCMLQLIWTVLLIRKVYREIHKSIKAPRKY
eukprot:20717_1